MQKALTGMPGTWQTQCVSVIITFIMRYPKCRPPATFLLILPQSIHCSLTRKKEDGLELGIIITERDGQGGQGQWLGLKWAVL